MRIQIDTHSNVEGGAELAQQIEAVVRNSLDRFSEPVARVEVYLSDQNSVKGFGTEDERCLPEALLAGLRPISGQALRDDTAGRMIRAARLICAAFLCCAVLSCTSAAAQLLDGSEDKQVPARSPDGKPDAPGRVEVQPVARDDEIRQRIAGILETTGWFGEPTVTVQEGIVFLEGTTDNDDTRQWAGDLAKNTEGVIAVVNRMELAPTTVWDFDPTYQELNDLARRFVRLLPLIVVAVVVIVISWVFARLTVYALRRGLLARSRSQLLREVAARAGGMLVILAGLYLVLRIAGLTQLAFTVGHSTAINSKSPTRPSSRARSATSRAIPIAAMISSWASATTIPSLLPRKSP